MSDLGWMAAIGGLLLFMALSSAHVKRLPVSTSVIYLLVGVAVGPAGFGLLRIDLPSSGRWFERLTEVAVIISLFVGGLKLRLPLRDPSWMPAVMLAGPVMLCAIAGVAVTGHYLFGLDPSLALLLGAILAPTDPVLASAVSVNDSADHDRVRFGLSGEAGLNDGAAFPFVYLGLEGLRHAELGSWVLRWGLERILWAVPAGLLTGYFLGLIVGRYAILVRSRQRDTGAPSDFLALALIALSYTAAEALHGWGFLAAFAAGVGLRHAERRVMAESPLPHDWRAGLPRWLGGSDRRRGARRSAEGADGAEARTPMPEGPPAEQLVAPGVSEESLRQPAVAAGVLLSEATSFGDTMERMLEVLLVVLVGIMVVDVWTPSALLLAALLFVLIRPISTLLLLARTRTTPVQRGLMGWFGIRGIGSLYYLAYAINHAEGADIASALVGPTITVVACSVVIHGVTVTPVVEWYERYLRRRP